MTDVQQRSPGVGRVLPLLLFVVFLLDAGLRLGPVDWLTFRGWEALTRFRAENAPFEASRVYVNRAAYGDLAALSNLPDLRVPRFERFSTDDHGFRNAESAFDRPFDTILLGNSFAAGSGLSDEDTLSSALDEVSGAHVYNAGGIGLTLNQLFSLADRLQIRRGTVILQYLERDPLPQGDSPRSPLAVWLKRVPGAKWAYTRALGYIGVSPLQILCSRWLKTIQNDAILPNAHASRVERLVLSNGDSMLFWPDDVTIANTKRATNLDYLVGLRDRLARRELRLLVLLVPTKYSVYGHPDNAGRYLAEVESALVARGVDTVNLAPSLMAAAESGLSSHRYVYWPDDTHWSPAGVEIAARLIAQRLAH